MDIDAILRESAAYFDALEEEGFDSSAEFKGEDDDPIAPILSQLKPIGDATFTEWFITLQGLMQESDNLPDFRDKLTESYPDLDAAEFKQAMLDASVVAGMRGYDDAASIDESDDAAQFRELLGSIPSSEYPAILSIVNTHYTDGIDRLDNARLNDDGSLICVGIDGNKQVAAKITDTKISIRLLNGAAEFAAPKNNGSLKKKTCKTGLSCGGTCISKSKVCARALSIKQQKQYKDLKKQLKSGDSDAQTGIQDLKDEQQGIKKEPAKPKESPKITTESAIAAIEASDMRKMDKQSAILAIKKLDFAKESHAAYAAASLETAGFYKKQEDGRVIDTDNGGTTSSFDRASELLRISSRKELSDDDAIEAGDSLRQGLRGHNGSAVNRANTLLAGEIWDRLSAPQQKIFASQIPEEYIETSSDSESIMKSDFYKKLSNANS